MELNKHERSYVQYIQKQIMEKLESGIINKAEDQYMFINDISHKLLLLKNDQLTDMINKYFETQEKVKEKILDINKELKILSDKYSDNTKKMYEEIKKL